MQIRVLVFGVLRELLGSPEVVCEMAAGTTAGDVVVRVRRDTGEAGGGVWGALAVAVNEVYASRDQVLQPGDVVALLPPVSGGADAVLHRIAGRPLQRTGGRSTDHRYRSGATVDDV